MSSDNIDKYVLQDEVKRLRAERDMWKKRYEDLVEENRHAAWERDTLD